MVKGEKLLLDLGLVNTIDSPSKQVDSHYLLYVFLLSHVTSPTCYEAGDYCVPSILLLSEQSHDTLDTFQKKCLESHKQAQLKIGFID